MGARAAGGAAGRGDHAQRAWPWAVDPFAVCTALCTLYGWTLASRATLLRPDVGAVSQRAAGTQRHLCSTLYIPSAILYRKYRGARRSGSTAQRLGAPFSAVSGSCVAAGRCSRYRAPPCILYTESLMEHTGLCGNGFTARGLGLPGRRSSRSRCSPPPAPARRYPCTQDNSA